MRRYPYYSAYPSQEHRHSFVRKNAVMAVFTIFKNFDFLIPDAPELIQNFMANVRRPCCVVWD